MGLGRFLKFRARHHEHPQGRMKGAARGRARGARRLAIERLEDRRLLFAAPWLDSGTESVEAWIGDRSYVADELVVAVRGPAATGLTTVAQAAARFAAAGPEALVPAAIRSRAFAATRDASGEALELHHVRLPAGVSVTTALAELASFAGSEVAWAAPNFVYEGDPRELVPNDPSYASQYHHPLMQNHLAWDIGQGAGIIVAVTDDGVDIDHVDLTTNIWVNPGEIAGNGLDDDGNGFIDDVNGWDFSSNDNNPRPQAGAVSTTHGTHVAGIVAARTNNALGVAGTAGQATIMPVRFYGSGSWTSTVIFNSYKYAADNGAKIINTSYNVDGFVNDPTFLAAVNYVYDRGVLHFNSAGNNGQLNPPRQAFDQLLFVANTTSTDVRSSTSNYGWGIDVAAPGSSILSTLPSNTYGSASGTSMATPNAAGAAAVLWAANPTWTREQVVAKLLGTADNIDAQNPTIVGLLGTGRVNTYRALTETLAPPRIKGLVGVSAGVLTQAPTQFTVSVDSRFDESMVENAANWELRSNGFDNVFGNGDDQVYSLTVQTDYRVGTNRIVLGFAGALTPLETYQFRAIAGGLRDPFGAALDGNADGAAGDDYTLEFTYVPGSTDGQLDPSFSADGKATLNSGFRARDTGQAMAVQIDGKYLVAGEVFNGSTTRSAIARFHANGALDTTFGTAGLTMFNPLARIWAIATQSDGKIVVVGESPGDFRVARFLANGALDTSFGSGLGYVTTAVGTGTDIPFALAIQPDGKIVVAGYAIVSGSDWDVAVVRYASTGALDTTFSGDGKHTFSMGTGNDAARAVQVLSDGSIVIGGQASSASTGLDFLLAKLTPAGVLDTAFGGGSGIATTAVATGTSSDQAYALQVQGDGKLVLAGTSSSDFAWARYLSDGTLDTSFNTTGTRRLTLGGTDVAFALAIQSDGKLVTAGYTTVGGSDNMAVVRLDADGALDTSLDGDGTRVLAISPLHDRAYGIHVQADGRIVLGGYSTEADKDRQFAVVRLESHGAIDAGFGVAGVGLVGATTVGIRDEFRAVAVQADGKAVAVGRVYWGSDYHVLVARYNLNGTLDTSFDGDGLAIISPTLGTAEARAVAIQADGKIVVAGFASATLTSTSDVLVLRLNSNGTLDTTFGGGDGVVLTAATTTNSDEGTAVTILADGRILVGGWGIGGTSTDCVVLRYLADGSLDTTFDGDGVRFVAINSSTDNAYAMRVMSDGRIVLAGRAFVGSTYDVAVVRLLASGAVDPTFGGGDGIVTTAIGTGTDEGYALDVAADGSIVVAGTTVGATNDFLIVRYLVDGTLDPAFGGGDGIVTQDWSGTDTARDVRILANGRIVVVGSGLNGSTTDVAIVRLSADGSPDTSFNAGQGWTFVSFTTSTDSGLGLGLMADGRVVAVGSSFNSTTGDDDATIARLQAAPLAQVSGVFVRGTAWQPGFTSWLDATGRGHPALSGLGHAVFVGGQQLDTLPWLSLDQITITFTTEVVVAAGDLLLLGSPEGPAALPAVSQFVNDTALRLARWTFASPLPMNKYLLVLSDAVRNSSDVRLDGDWTHTADTFPSGDGASGGDFEFRFHVVPGDVDNSGGVVFAEVAQMRLKIGRTTAATDYNVRQDVDGSGGITFSEVAQSRLRVGSSIAGYSDPASPGPDTGEAGPLVEIVPGVGPTVPASTSPSGSSSGAGSSPPTLSDLVLIDAVFAHLGRSGTSGPSGRRTLGR